MAEARYDTTTRLPVEEIWAFVRDMDNWARFVTGYQAHEKRSDTESVWTLKGDLGVMSRTLTFEVHITEWNGPSRVRFSLRGLNEPMRGEGAFTIGAYAPAPAADPASGPTAPPSGPQARPSGQPSAPRDGSAAAAGPPAHDHPRKSLLARWLEALARWFLGLVGGRARREAPTAAGAGQELSRMSFELRIDPGGPMAPMVNAMIQPLMLPAAEQLADKILAHLERRPGAAGTGPDGGAPR